MLADTEDLCALGMNPSPTEVKDKNPIEFNGANMVFPTLLTLVELQCNSGNFLPTSLVNKACVCAKSCLPFKGKGSLSKCKAFFFKKRKPNNTEAEVSCSSVVESKLSFPSFHLGNKEFS